jgi:hypothetical protein
MSVPDVSAVFTAMGRGPGQPGQELSNLGIGFCDAVKDQKVKLASSIFRKIQAVKLEERWTR